MVANNTQIYWQNTAHSNHPVLVAALGVGAERFKGYYDNADFGQKLKALMEGKNRKRLAPNSELTAHRDAKEPTYEIGDRRGKQANAKHARTAEKRAPRGKN